MKRLFLLSLFLLLIAGSSLQAQSWKLTRSEFVFGLGTANVFGDFSGSTNLDNENLYGLKDLMLFDTRPSLLLAGRYKVSDRVSARLNFLYTLSKSDATNSILPFESSMLQRESVVSNTHIMEITPQVEYYVLREERKSKSAAIFNRRGMVNSFSTFSAYLFTGAGAAYTHATITDPQEDFIVERADEINMDGTWTVVLPAGFGLKYVLNGRYVLGFEFGGRYTLSDYIDGFSPTVGLSAEQYPKGKTANDIYYFTSLNLSYKLITDRNGIPQIFSGGGVKSKSKGFGIKRKVPKARSRKAATRSRNAPVIRFNSRRR